MPICARKASFVYPSGTSPALDSVDLTVQPGEIVALAGSSGSGKTTLARLICGLITPTSGEVEIDGLKTSHVRDRHDIRKCVGLVFQNPDDQMVCQTVEREIAFTLENLGMEPGIVHSKVNKVLAAFDIESLVEREPSQLSGGERAMVAVASVVVVEPRYLVLDEPTSLLDARGSKLFRSMLGGLVERGLGVILLTQYADEALFAKRLVILENGKKTYDGPSESLLLDGNPEAYGFWKPSVRRVAEELGVWQKIRRTQELSYSLKGARDAC